MSQYVAFTPEQFHALDDKLTEINNYRIVVTTPELKEPIEQMLARGGVNVTVDYLTPVSMAEDNFWVQSNIRLCWSVGSVVVFAPIAVEIRNGTPTVYAYSAMTFSLCSGKLGIDESWTITTD